MLCFTLTRSRLRLLGAVIALAAASIGPARASDALARKHACAACHQPDRKLVGPSWKDVATKYGEGRLGAQELAASIKKGGTGKWGPIPMPPQGHVPDADLQALAIWALGGEK
jgi:cytochrome c